MRQICLTCGRTIPAVPPAWLWCFKMRLELFKYAGKERQETLRTEKSKSLTADL